MRRVVLGFVIALVVVAGGWFFRSEIIDQARLLHPALGDALAQDRSGPFAAIVKRVSPAVVTIISKAKQAGKGSIGSGFVIDPEGHIVTNDHVIDNANKIEVLFPDGSRLPAVLVGTDKPVFVIVDGYSFHKPNLVRYLLD
jgi:S1-C subfamily serine protease